MWRAAALGVAWRARTGTAASSTSTEPDRLISVPSGLQVLYDKSKGGTYKCDYQIDRRSGGYSANGSGKDGTHICGDAKKPSYVWWASNMDVDCDGGSTSDNACSNDQSHQTQTTFKDSSGKWVDAVSIPYVVIDDDSDFSPEKLGIQPMSAVAVVCNGKLTFGVWADTNGDGSMGEVSLKLAQTCFGSGMTGNSGHDAPDVLYVAFIGSKADTVPSGSTSDYDKLSAIGTALVSKALSGAGGTDNTSASASASKSTTSSATTVTSSTILTLGSSVGESITSSPSSMSASSVTLTSPTSSPAASGLVVPFDLSSTKILAIVGIMFVVILVTGIAVYLLVHQHPPLRRERSLSHSDTEENSLLSSEDSEASYGNKKDVQRSITPSTNTINGRRPPIQYPREV
ncbi:Chitosanase-domain-containing protein [Meredithblackwellia eburnea MCA 4105]